ncbi:Glyoxylate/hydroxypyruvate reductase B [Streptomyces hirsutus]
MLVDAGFEVRIGDSRDPDVIASLAADAVALIVGYARVDAALLDRLPALRMIATMSAGYDMIDTAEAARRGLWVTNLPAAATEDVAVHAFACALSLIRRLPQADAVVRARGWNEEFAAGRLPRRASELTLGLVGLGRIARHLATIAAPVFGRIAAYDPHTAQADWPARSRYDALERRPPPRRAAPYTSATPPPTGRRARLVPLRPGRPFATSTAASSRPPPRRRRPGRRRPAPRRRPSACPRPARPGAPRGRCRSPGPAVPLHRRAGAHTVPGGHLHVGNLLSQPLVEGLALVLLGCRSAGLGDAQRLFGRGVVGLGQVGVDGACPVGPVCR